MMASTKLSLFLFKENVVRSIIMTEKGNSKSLFLSADRKSYVTTLVYPVIMIFYPVQKDI